MTATSALPPGRLLYRLAIAHYASRAVHLMAVLGIADLLREIPWGLIEIQPVDHAA